MDGIYCTVFKGKVADVSEPNLILYFIKCGLVQLTALQFYHQKGKQSEPSCVRSPLAGSIVLLVSL